MEAGPASARSYFIGDAARTRRRRREARRRRRRRADRDAAARPCCGSAAASAAAVRSPSSSARSICHGTGSYALDVGDVKLAHNGTVRITAKGNGVELIELTDRRRADQVDGRLELEVGKSIDLGIEPGRRSTPGSRDAAVRDAATDAAGRRASPRSSDATIEVTGKRAELLRAGRDDVEAAAGGHRRARPRAAQAPARRRHHREADRAAAPRSSSPAARASRSPTATRSLGSSSAARRRRRRPRAARSAARRRRRARRAPPTRLAEARIDVNARDDEGHDAARRRRSSTGASGAELEMSRGETASLAKAGTIRASRRSRATSTSSVAGRRDRSRPRSEGADRAAVRVRRQVPDGGIIEMDHDARFRTAKVSGGKDSANMLRRRRQLGVPAALHAGRQRGRRRSRPAGSRRARRRPPPAAEDPAAQRHRRRRPHLRISYQSADPERRASTSKSPGADAQAPPRDRRQRGDVRQREAGDQRAGQQAARRARYTYWFDRDGVKQDKVSTLMIDFDQTAAQVYIESPTNGAAVGAAISTSRRRAAGLDRRRRGDRDPDRQAAPVHGEGGSPTGKALAIRLSHPQRGVHYYLRRPK